jgi:hypothetical protein
MDGDSVVCVGAPVVTPWGGGFQLQAAVEIAGRSSDLFFRVSEGSPPAAAMEAFLAASLLPAMDLRGALRLHGPISPRLASSLGTIQDILAMWHPRYSPVAVLSDPGQCPGTGSGQEVGCFFSGGVDSFYTIAKHRGEITRLILVHGFDIPLENDDLRQSVGAELRRAAAELGIPLLEVETNIRQLTDRHGGWAETGCGIGLAGVALLLSGQFRKVFIPASESYAHLGNCGSHPLLDPLWSTDSLEVVHDGCEADRNRKVRLISSLEVALRTLRVCWENPGNAYNCGRCEKCLRTMVNLRIAGSLERCPAFASPLTADAVAGIRIRSDLVLRFHEDNLRALEESGLDPELERALRHCIGRYRAYRFRAEMDRGLEEHGAAYAWWICSTLATRCLRRIAGRGRR